MSVRFKALLFSLLVVSACTPDSVAAPPPAARAPQVAAAPGAAVPADRWRAVLIAGDSNSPAFDNGVEALRDKLLARGVRDVTALTSDPAANPSMQPATAANVSEALRGGGGEACLAFVTSHATRPAWCCGPPGACSRLRRSSTRSPRAAARGRPW